MNDFSGMRVLVTGGTRGIGFATAGKFIERGARVLITGREADTLSRAREQLGDNAVSLQWDMADIGSMRDGLRKAVDMLGGLDVLVNNAGILKGGLFLDATPAEFDDVMRVNVRGVYFLCQYAAKYMIEGGIRGHIVNVCSNMGYRMISDTPYGVSKWAVRGMTMGMGRELARYGIIVNAVCPGPVTTKMMGWQEGKENHFPHIPIERYSTPEEVAETILFLAKSPTIVGECLVADGGERLY